jgi:hypothetical protein
MESAVEVTYPAAEGIVTGFLLFVGNIFSIIVVLIADELEAPKTHSMQNAFYFMGGLLGLSLLGGLFFRGPYKRYVYERTRREYALLNETQH